MDGVTTLRVPPALRFTLSGQQPEQCILISQTLSLEPSRAYRLSFEFRTSGASPGSGLRLRVLDQTSPDLAADAWTPEALNFTAAGPTGEIAVDYQRPSGVPRLEGTLEIRKFKLNRL